MSPSELRKHLATYADGELDPAQRAEVEQRLSRDPAAQAEVERWRSLRRAVGQVLAQTATPPGLAQRVRDRIGSERRTHRPRVIGLGLSGLAVAAAVILAVVLQPRLASATSVETRGLASIYRDCAVTHRHDAFGLRNAEGEVCARPWAQMRARSRLGTRLPRLSLTADYQFDGACQCAPPGVRVVHAYFRHQDDPEDVISVFVTDRPVDLCHNGKPCRCCRAGERPYQRGHCGDVRLVCWKADGRAFVLAGQGHDAQHLVEMADGLSVAHLKRVEQRARTFLAAVAAP